MRILSLHNRYLLAGGEDNSHEAECALLRARGHEVDVIVEDNKRVKRLGRFRTAARSIWSRESYMTVLRQLQSKRYDIVHVQNFFPLFSPSVYYAAQAAGVPVVQTLRNYRLLCPSATLYREGRVCEDCLKRVIPWPSVYHGCYRNSRRGSAVVGGMLVLHRMLGTWQRAVSVYIALTDFARDKFIEGGLPQEKIEVVPNFVWPDPSAGDHHGDFFLFVGRLAREKGLETLLAAWRGVRGEARLKIVGEGPLEAEVRTAAAQLPGLDYVGRQPLREVYRMMGDARAVVFPSGWYEGLPRTIIEAFAKGTPVVASDIGAMRCLVDDRRTGRHFKVGRADSLAEVLNHLSQSPGLCGTMGRQARREYEAKYTGQAVYQQLATAYEVALTRAGRRGHEA